MIGALGAAELLDLWDAGHALSGPERGLSILSSFDLGTPAETATLSAGWRDRSLLAVHHAVYGPKLAGLVTCADCQRPIEIELDIRALDAVMRPAEDADAEALASWFPVVADALSCRCRASNTVDHAAMMAGGDPIAGRRILIERCIRDVMREAMPVAVEDLTPTEIERIGAAIEARDPGAVVSVDYRCPACGTSGLCLLDLPALVWGRVQSEAQRLLHEIDALARAYGWRESDVLALTPQRRRRYLHLVSA